MIEPRKRAYLEAMGFDVWQLRPEPPPPGGLVIGPGEGSTLLICDSPAACATRLASDLVRALGGDPAWAWPQSEHDTEGESLDDAIARRLFTRVIVFGSDVEAWLFEGPGPAVVGSSAIQVEDGLDELAVRGSAKQAFWEKTLASPQSD
jgi:hypothetical protein